MSKLKKKYVLHLIFILWQKMIEKSCFNFQTIVLRSAPWRADLCAGPTASRTATCVSWRPWLASTNEPSMSSLTSRATLLMAKVGLLIKIVIFWKYVYCVWKVILETKTFSAIFRLSIYILSALDFDHITCPTLNTKPLLQSLPIVFTAFSLFL